MSLLSESVAIQYLPIALFFFIAILLSCLITLLPVVLAKFKPNKSKSSTYECGFNPLAKLRVQFDIKFYLIAILFIIFDLEIIFLVPWSLVLKDIGSLGFYSMIIFLSVLVIGFIYEWNKGALD